MQQDLLYQLALSKVPHIGDVHAKILVSHFGNAGTIFSATKKQLERIEGIGSIRASHIKSFDNFDSCEKEIRFIEKYKIDTLFYTDAAYPKRLKNCHDSPILLFYRGNADLNASKILAIVGTRHNSLYGKQLTEQIIHELSEQGILILSGLALGIDTIAHKAALQNNLLTVAVLAHGLDRIYPVQNTALAKQLIEHGGLLTDFCSGTKPDKQNFPRRNRIVAGLCDALLVVESAEKGGSLITADIAESYHKDILAIPGRITDAKSSGCNNLIQQNKAALIKNGTDILNYMNWIPSKKKPVLQGSLFLDLSEDEKKIMALLEKIPDLEIDEINLQSGLSNSLTAQALLMLELKGLVLSLPGKRFRAS